MTGGVAIQFLNWTGPAVGAIFGPDLPVNQETT